MSDQVPGRLPEHPDWRAQVWRGFRLDDSEGRCIYVALFPEVIVAHLDATDTRVHVPDELDIPDHPGEAYVWEDIAGALNIRPRLFEEADGTWVLTFHDGGDVAGKDPYENVAYEWNIDDPDPARSGWKAVRYATPVDEWFPKQGRLAGVMDDIGWLCSVAGYLDARAIVAAAPETACDTAAEIDALIDWLRDVQRHVNERFSAEAG